MQLIQGALFVLNTFKHIMQILQGASVWGVQEVRGRSKLETQVWTQLESRLWLKWKLDLHLDLVLDSELDLELDLDFDSDWYFHWNRIWTGSEFELNVYSIWIWTEIWTLTGSGIGSKFEWNLTSTLGFKSNSNLFATRHWRKEMYIIHHLIITQIFNLRMKF